ncbi:MAG: ATP synthase subunit C [Oscillospiraceae bacterium]|jgi:V/A-type H+-transporting ATPase subunit K|nr:ATP synthase subunit C [Oscillospiraceae bacterium]
MEIFLIFFPFLFLFSSIFICAHLVKNGKKPKQALITQISLFAVIVFSFIAFPLITFAEGASKAVSSDVGMGKGVALLAAAVVGGMFAIGGGIAVAASAPAAIGATAEDPKSFAKSLIFVALGEAITIFGVLLSFMLMNKV